MFLKCRVKEENWQQRISLLDKQVEDPAKHVIEKKKRKRKRKKKERKIREYQENCNILFYINAVCSRSAWYFTSNYLFLVLKKKTTNLPSHGVQLLMFVYTRIWRFSSVSNVMKHSVLPQYMKLCETFPGVQSIKSTCISENLK